MKLNAVYEIFIKQPHQEKGNNCSCQCIISRLLWAEIVQNGSITIKWLTQALKCPQMHWKTYYYNAAAIHPDVNVRNLKYTGVCQCKNYLNRRYLREK